MFRLNEINITILLQNIGWFSSSAYNQLNQQKQIEQTDDCT